MQVIASLDSVDLILDGFAFRLSALPPKPSSGECKHTLPATPYHHLPSSTLPWPGLPHTALPSPTYPALMGRFQ